MENKSFLAILFIVLTSIGIYSYANFGVPKFSAGAAADGEFIAISNDGGKSFQAASIYNVLNPRNFEIYAIEFNPLESKLAYAGTNQGLFVSKDGGISWHSYSDPEKKLGEKMKIYDIISNPKKPDQFFVSVFSGNDSLFGQKNGKGYLYETTDNFFTVKTLNEFENAAITSFEFSDNRLYMRLSDGKNLEYSVETSSFRALSANNMPVNKQIYTASLVTMLQKNAPVNSVNVGENGDIFAASGSMLYISRNSGYSWEAVRPLENERDISTVLVSKKIVAIGTK